MREAATRIWLRVNALLRRRQLDRDLEDELAFHSCDARRHTRRAPALRQRRRCGRSERASCGRSRRWKRSRRISATRRGCSAGFRAFAAVAIVRSRSGIGANTAIFSLMDAVLWKMLPVREPAQPRPAGVYRPARAQQAFPYPVYEQLRDRSEVFSGMFAFSGESRWSLGAGGQAELVVGQMVSGTFHSVLGVNAQAGRTLTLGGRANTQGAHPVAVISDGYWSRRFGRDPSAIGMAITINGRPFTVVGVTPRGFFGVSVGSRPDVTVPLAVDAAISGRQSNLKNAGYSWLHIFARLKPGTTAAEALTETRVAYRQITDAIAATTTDPRQLRELHARTLELRSASQGLDRMRRRFSMPLGVLAAMVGLTLLIACLNIANLLLARASARRREMAMRLAIGASRGRLIRQLLTESTLLAVAGGALGLVMAQWSGSALLRLASGSDPIPIDLPADLRVFAFTAVVAVATGVLCGLAPAMLATRRGRGPAAIDGHLRGPQRSRLSKALVVLQVAVSVLLLVGAGLFVRTLQNLNGVDTGFDRDHLIVFAANPVLAGQTRERAGRFSMELADWLDSHSGSACGGPLALRAHGGERLDDASDRARVHASFRERCGRGAEPGRSQVLRHRRDGPGRRRPVRRARFPGGPGRRRDQRNDGPRLLLQPESPGPHGHHQRRGEHGHRHREGRQVVRRTRTLRPARRTCRFRRPGRRFPARRPSPCAPAATRDEVMARIREEAAALDPGVPLYKMSTMNELIDRSLGQERLIATLAGFFGALALLLACVGLYGLMSYAVALRTKEIGIRLALGAQPGTVRRERHPRDAPARRRRHRARRAGGRGGRAARRRPAVRALAAGSGDARRRRRGDDDRRGARRVPAGPPGLRGPADGGASSRVKARRRRHRTGTTLL